MATTILGPLSPAQAAALRDPASTRRVPLGGFGVAAVTAPTYHASANAGVARLAAAAKSNAAAAVAEAGKAVALEARRDPAGATAARVRSTKLLEAARESAALFVLRVRGDVPKTLQAPQANEAKAQHFARIRPQNQAGSFVWASYSMGGLSAAADPFAATVSASASEILSHVSGLGFSLSVKDVESAVSDEYHKVVSPIAQNACMQAAEQARKPAEDVARKQGANAQLVKQAGDDAVNAAKAVCGKAKTPGAGRSSGGAAAHPAAGKGGVGALAVLGAVAFAAAKVFALI